VASGECRVSSEDHAEALTEVTGRTGTELEQDQDHEYEQETEANRTAEAGTSNRNPCLAA